MKTKKKLTAIGLAAALAVTGVSGCSGEDSASGAAEFEPQLDTETEASFSIVANLQNFEALEAVITDFGEYYPNVSVEYSCIDDYTGNIEARLKSDSKVGIFMTQGVMYDAEYYTEISVNLKEEIDLSVLRDEAVNAATVDGEVHWLPLALSANGFAVNVTLLEEYGLEVPTNYEEFLNCCAVMKENGYTPIQGGNMAYNVFLGLIKSNVYSAIMNAEESGDDVVAAMTNADDGCTEFVREAYTIARELLDSGYIDIDLCESFEDNYNDVILRFFEGDVPFMLMSTTTFSGTEKRETKSEAYSENPFEYIFTYMPFGEDDGCSYIENWIGFAVNENCEEKEMALEFMRFLATEDELNELASIKGVPSVAKNTDDDRFSIYTEDSENTTYNTVFVPTFIEEAIVNGAITLDSEDATVDEAMEAMLEYLKTAQESE